MLDDFTAHQDGSNSGDGTARGASITGVALGLLHAVLNQVDYGLAVVNADTRQLVYANAPALDALNPDSPQTSGLCVVQGRVFTRQPAHAAQLALALARTKERLRGLLRLADDGLRGPGTAGEAGETGSGHGSRDSTVAVMPLFELALATIADGAPASSPAATPASTSLAFVGELAVPAPTARTAPTALPTSDTSAPSTPAMAASPAPCYALLVFPKQQLCDTTTITLFARERGLTGTEGQVLALVCKGLRPSQIASNHGVQVCTVRSQLRSIRQKTASDSVRELVEKVSVLPPMARHLPQVFAALSPRPQTGASHPFQARDMVLG